MRVFWHRNPWKEATCREEESIQWGADLQRAQASQDRNPGCGDAAPNGYFGTDILLPEDAVRLTGFGELRRLEQFEDENRKLKQLLADLSLDKHILQEVLSKSLRAARQLEIAQYVQSAHGVSEQRSPSCSDLRPAQHTISVSQSRPDAFDHAHPRHSANANAIRLFPDLHYASTGELGCEPQACSPALSQESAELAAQTATPECQCRNASKPACGDSTERTVADGLQIRSAVRWAPLTGTDRGRCA